MAGTPVLGYGPPGIAQVEYARQAGWGDVLDRQGLDGLMRAIETVAGDLPLRRRLSQAARRTAAAQHDSATVRRRFQAVLTETAQAHSLKRDA